MFKSTKIIELGSCAFRQPTAESHCKYLHGYRLTAKFWFEAESLDQNNWVVDFGGLKELKSILQSQFDHTTCISRVDPKLDEFKRLEQAGVCDLRIMDGVGIEKFAEWCHRAANQHVSELTNNRCRCVKVEVFEHENNSAIYEPTTKPVVSEQALTDFMGNKDVKPAPVVASPVKNKPTNNISSNTNKVKNKWVDPKAPKNSWLF
jgi:6-pyruvoyltetrahydropterin/6-carboxytetrahydropterin synthase